MSAAEASRHAVAVQVRGRPLARALIWSRGKEVGPPPASPAPVGRPEGTMKRSILSIVLVIVSVAATTAAETERKDLQVFNDVSQKVRTYAHFTIFDDVRAQVAEGHVILTGRVTMPFKRGDIERRVARVGGVRSVQNQIDVLPVSNYDNELRARIARAIYGNPNFWHYAAMANPPIHIVVERGHVTLAGVVHNEVERMLARSLATSLGAFSVTVDLKTDAEVQELLEKIG
jgi:osmotically-inducible protein OsmY